MCITCYFALVKLCAYLQGIGLLTQPLYTSQIVPPGSFSPWNRSRLCMVARTISLLASSSRIHAYYGDLKDQLYAALTCIGPLKAAAKQP